MTSIMKIQPGKLSGSIEIQSSKSVGHRMAICAALSGAGAQVYNLGRSEDILATVGSLQALGYPCELASYPEGCVLTAAGTRKSPEAPRRAACGESGSTLRFLLPLALTDGVETFFSGRGRLMERPMSVYETLCREQDIEYGFVPGASGQELRVKGRLRSGRFALPGNISSQFITGLLLALPLLEGDSVIELTTELESRGYVELTREAMAAFGVQAFWKGEALHVPGGQQYRTAQVIVEGDWSHSAFFLAAGALGGSIRCTGLRSVSAQGDRAILPVLSQMGAKAAMEDSVAAAEGGELYGTVIDGSQIPDLVPVLAAAACGAKGETRIVNAARLRIKESDRLAAMAQELRNLGGDVEETVDGMVIHGTGRLRGGRCDSHNDHRIAMSLAVASAICEEPVLLSGWQSVKKSAPAFFEEFRSLGGKAQEVEL